MVLSEKELTIQLLKKFESLKKGFESFKEATNLVINALKVENGSLKERLAKYENPKNTINSSIIANPNIVVIHDIAQCACCGNELPKADNNCDARQVFDLSPIKIEVTEHRRLQKTCLYCGRKNKATFPKAMNQEAQYGKGIKSLCAYLQNYQRFPYLRCSEFINDLTGHQIATGSLSNFQQQCFTYLKPYQQEVMDLLSQSSILYADETGIRLNGNNSWVHVISNKAISLFGHHLKRGKEAMNAMGILENYKGILVHDRFSSYFSCNCDHGLCNAHILRDLVYVEETFDAQWAKQIKDLLIRAKNKKTEMSFMKLEMLFNKSRSSLLSTELLLK